MVKYDPHMHKEQYLSWKNRGCPMPDILPENRQIILDFIEDMEIGININPSSRKGARSFGRLRNIKAKMQTMSFLLEQELGMKKLQEMEFRELDLLKFFKKMREGGLMCRKKSEPLKAVGTYARIFKSFWHWYTRSQRRQGRDIRDITVDLDATSEKPHFNYFTVEDLRKMCDEATYFYRTMMMFMFDSGIRSPTEMMNVKASDLEWNPKQNHYTLTIREETSKTFGRRIKLMLCSEILKGYIESQQIKPEQYLFQKQPRHVNQYLKRLGYKILKIGTVNEKIIEGKIIKKVTKGLTMYDFRHSSACYWVPRYKSESAMKYRFGWKKSEMINYYTELLGMRDTIDQEDLYVDITKTELEQQLQQKGKEIDVMKEEISEQNKKMKEIIEIMHALNIEKLIDKKIDM